jgi:uncharacterized protein
MSNRVLTSFMSSSQFRRPNVYRTEPFSEEELVREEEDFDLLSDDNLLAEMVRALVSKPEKVEVDQYCDATKTHATKVLVIKVDPRDCGKVIGKQGRMAELLRTFMSTVGVSRGYPISITIEGGVSRNMRRSRPRRGIKDIADQTEIQYFSKR